VLLAVEVVLKISFRGHIASAAQLAAAANAVTNTKGKDLKRVQKTASASVRAVPFAGEAGTY